MGLLEGASAGMTHDRWNRFLRFAKLAREKPTFDEEVRAPKLEVAQCVRKMLEFVKGGGEWIPALNDVFNDAAFLGSISHFTAPAEHIWFKRLVNSQSAVFGDVLSGFLDDERTPIECFRSFADAVGPPPTPDQAIPHASRVVAFGSLFNFAVNPENLPFVRTALFERLERALACPCDTHAPAVEMYQCHLQFAEKVRDRLEKQGVRIRDTIDAGGLILLASRHDDFWTSDPQEFTQLARQGDIAKSSLAYLSICAIYRDEAPYLAEWIEFHRLVGVERFFLYDNMSRDDHLEVLAPYLEDGTVVLQDWRVEPGQIPAYLDCLKWHRYDSRWIAFIDLDEFLFSPTRKPVSEVLRDYEAWPGVAVNWSIYGFSGHRTKPTGLVTESYVRRLDIFARNRLVKSIVDPTRVERPLAPHHFHYPYLSAVDENHYPVDGPKTKSVSFSRLRINHYYSKSEEEFLAKLQGARADGLTRQRFTADDLPRQREFEDTCGQDDYAILTYVPALRAALENRGGVVSGSE